MGMIKQRKRPNIVSPDAESTKGNDSQLTQQIQKFENRCKNEIKVKNLKRTVVWNLLSLLLYVGDIVIDIYWLITFYVQGDDWYFYITLTFLIIPAVISTVRSFLFYNPWLFKKNRETFDPRDYLEKESKCCNPRNAMKWFLSFLLVCPIPRYWDVIKYAKNADKETDDDTKKMYYLAMIWEDVELTQLRQFDCFMETAPQLLLNLYILVQGGYHFDVVSVISYIFSFISLSWALVSYDGKIGLVKGIKNEDENEKNQSNGIGIDYKSNTAIKCINDVNWISIALLFLANLFWIVARLLALSLFASVYGWIIWPACLCHLIPIFAWHWNENNYSFMNSLRLSFLHIFAYLYPIGNESDKEKHPRFSPIMYRLVCLCENMFLMILWSQSEIKSDIILDLGISSVSFYLLDKLTFVVPWIVQLVTLFSSFFLFWLFNQARNNWFY